MDATTLARWQFATTTIYHFLIVPLSIGLTVLVAVMQTQAYRKRGTDAGPEWDRAARFWGRIMLVLFALGVVTGIVQEFQFGMNWSAYSRFVGDVFGAPLAMEGIVAFFLESTFLGLWVFGRDLLAPRVHLATIWLAALGTVASAYFILAANSFMQHPVGIRYDAARHRVELTSIWKVLTNSTQLAAFPHTLFASLLSAGAILLSVSAWHLRRRDADRVHRRVAGLALGVVIVAAAGSTVSGDSLGQLTTSQQPMKIAAAEALWDTRSGAPLSLFAYGSGKNAVDVSIPYALSLLAHKNPHASVQGINDVQAESVERFGPGDYRPIVWLQYWSYRAMIGLGLLAGALAVAIAWRWRRGRLRRRGVLLRVATWAVALPLAANSAGWIFTETGRQPWLVYGLLRTADGVSPNVGAGYVLASLVGFSVLYGVLGVICFRIVRRIAQAGPEPAVLRKPEPEPVLSLV